jgi:hypothetical protein
VPKGRAFKNLEGRRFGRWTVLRLHGYQPKSEKHVWWCRCECGYEKAVRVDHLTRFEDDGRKKMCTACSWKVGKAIRRRKRL